MLVSARVCVLKFHAFICMFVFVHPVSLHVIIMCACVCVLQSLLVAQQLANAVGGVMSGAAPGLNQPILIPFNAGGHLGGQQGLDRKSVV